MGCISTRNEDVVSICMHTWSDFCGVALFMIALSRCTFQVDQKFYRCTYIHCCFYIVEYVRTFNLFVLTRYPVSRLDPKLHLSHGNLSLFSSFLLAIQTPTCHHTAKISTYLKIRKARHEALSSGPSSLSILPRTSWFEEEELKNKSHFMGWKVWAHIQTPSYSIFHTRRQHIKQTRPTLYCPNQWPDLYLNTRFLAQESLCVSPQSLQSAIHQNPQNPSCKHLRP